jgi:membrane-associated phospholipid phosphatase
MTKPNYRLAFTYGLYLAILMLLVVASIFISKGDDVLWINGHHSTFSDRFFLTVTYLGAGFLFIPLIFVLSFVRFKYVVLTLLVWAGHGIICAVLKRGIFGYMKRPKEILDNSLLYFVPNETVHSHFSFPSGHTATIFCFSFLLSLLIRKRLVSVGLLLIALLVAYSRIYLLQHFLMDVTAGAAVGTLFTYISWRYFEVAKLPEWMNSYLKINLTLRLAE